MQDQGYNYHDLGSVGSTEEAPANLSILAVVVEGKSDPVGFVRFSRGDTLHKLRQQMTAELDSLPENFCFVIAPRGTTLRCPVSIKQELTEQLDIESQILIRSNGRDVVTKPENTDSKRSKECSSSESEFSMSDYDDHEGLLEEYGIPHKKPPPTFRASRKAHQVQDSTSIMGEEPEPECKDFKVVERDITDSRTSKRIKTEKFVVFSEDANDMKNVMRQVTELSSFYERDPKLRLSSLVYYLPKMRNHSKGSAYKEKYLKPLIELVEREYKDVVKEIEAMIANGEITFHYLWYLFPNEAKLVGHDGDELFATEVHDSKYRSGFFGATFQVGGYIIKADGARFFTSLKWFTIGEYEGLRRIHDLPIQPLKETDDQYRKLLDRGHKFRQIGVGAHYMMYRGNLLWRDFSYTSKFKADGRVMVDGTSFSRFNPDYRGFSTTSDDERTLTTIPEEKLYQTWPTIPGFSFAAKKWGELRIPDLGEIRFDEDAFHKLVMEERKKRLIYSLVTNSEKTFTDVISGKGGGCIFLLHGPPGVGKTLTAEAIAELLHRPLYSITVGELGITTADLERKLRQILEVASIWNAVILIDEADIFLERRSGNDINRNALVGIFLRLLEYHQGVLFLTTNRVEAFDEAFHSRISVALHYEPLAYEARKKVWENLLSAAGINNSSLDTSELAKYNLNGRQIKTTIRLAQALAFSEEVPMGPKHVAETIEVTKQFESDLKEKG